MATLSSKRKLASVSGERPEITWNTQSRNTIDPEVAQEKISQVFEQIEGKVTKKTIKRVQSESGILRALSKLDEYLLSPQVRICSVAVPGALRNDDSESREPTEDRSLNDACPEARFSSHLSGNLIGPELEESPHTYFF